MEAKQLNVEAIYFFWKAIGLASEDEDAIDLDVLGRRGYTLGCRLCKGYALAAELRRLYALGQVLALASAWP